MPGMGTGLGPNLLDKGTVGSSGVQVPSRAEFSFGHQVVFTGVEERHGGKSLTQ